MTAKTKVKKRKFSELSEVPLSAWIAVMRANVPEKLLKIVDEIDSAGDARLTRLTMLKKWFEQPDRLVHFALWIESRTSSRKGKTKGEAATPFRAVRALLADLDRVHPQIDLDAARALHDRLRAFQNEYRNDRWIFTHEALEDEPSKSSQPQHHR